MRRVDARARSAVARRRAHAVGRREGVGEDRRAARWRRNPLDWLAELAPRLPWVNAALPSLLATFAEGTPEERRAALALGERGKARPTRSAPR